MKKEQLIAKGLSEQHAQIAVDFCKQELRGFVPKSRFDEVNMRLKAANAKLAAGGMQSPHVCTYREPEQITIQITMNDRR